jgi:hypothetical protein
VLLPFSARAKKWEPYAQALRKRLNLSSSQILDPYKLAVAVGLRLVDLRSVCEQLDRESADLVLLRDKDSWSGGVFARPLPDGTRICILNSTHGPRRTKMTLMEEIAHIHLRHIPTSLMRLADGLRRREYNMAQEEEAYGVGAAALLPWDTFFRAINSGRTIDQLAEKHDLSEQLVQYRIQITGASKLYQARQRSRN